MKIRGSTLWITGMFMIVLIFIGPSEVEAHNCSDFRDCYDTLRAAVSATVALSIFAVVLSLGHVVSPPKGRGSETEENIETDHEEALQKHERMLGIVDHKDIPSSDGSSAVDTHEDTRDDSKLDEKGFVQLDDPFYFSYLDTEEFREKYISAGTVEMFPIRGISNARYLAPR